MPELTIEEKRQKLLAWVRRKNASAEYRKHEFRTLWKEIKPYFDLCEGDDDFKFKLMCEATNYS